MVVGAFRRVRRRRRARRWGCAEGEERARSAGVPTGAAAGGPKARLESVGKVITRSSEVRILGAASVCCTQVIFGVALTLPGTSDRSTQSCPQRPVRTPSRRAKQHESPSCSQLSSLLQHRAPWLRSGPSPRTTPARTTSVADRCGAAASRCPCKPCGYRCILDALS